METPQIKLERRRRVVVVAIDESGYSEQAYTWYLTHLSRKNDKVVLIHCPENCSEAQSPIIFSGVNATGGLTEEERTRFRALVHMVREKVKPHGIVEKVRNLSVNPGEIIIQAAKEENAAMIVVGSRGTGAKRRSHTSVSNYVLHHSPVPVVLCHHETLHP